MGRKRELKDVDWIAKEGGLTPDEELDFRDYLHECKASGLKGSKNDRGDFTKEEMRERLTEFKDALGKSEDEV